MITTLKENPSHNFNVDDEVIYIPNHAEGDRNHPSCEKGTVSKVDLDRVWVRYSHGSTGALSPIKNLIHVQKLAQ